MELQTVLTIFSISYLIGSIPTAYVVGRLHGINIFEVGSGNMGANNTARALGAQWGAVVWVLDGIKGAIALLLARHLIVDEQSAAMILAAIAVVFGHNWSLFATMLTGTIRGGKGAATASGTWLLLAPPLLLAGVLMLGAALVALTRYMSLAVLTSIAVASLIIVIAALIKDNNPIYIAYILVPAMIFYRHRTNIQSLLNGTERRFGDRV